MPTTFWLYVGIPLLTVLVAFAVVGVLFPWLLRRAIKHVLTHNLSDTLAELYVSMQSTPPIQLLYLSLRSTTGESVIRPMGSARPVKGLDDLAFVPAQLAVRPLDYDAAVDLETVLGANAPQPLRMRLPIIISGMAYGLALTREARLALAKGSAMAGIPLNSGQGPFFDEERELAHTYVLQFGRWVWNRDPEILKQADMIEVQVGQGAQPGNAVLSAPSHIGPEIHRLMHLPPDEAPIIHANLFLDVKKAPATLKEVVAYLRDVTPKVPIAIKMGAGDALEWDLDVALEAKVDTIVIDGTEGATGNAPITISDHFGIPTLSALTRAVRHLEKRGQKGKVDLVISGGLREPGDFLKCYALGADAVALGTAAMFAVAHPQIQDVFPFYPPTDLVFYRSRPQIPIRVDQGARALFNYLESCRKEMEIALRTVGVRTHRDLRPGHLSTGDQEIAMIAGVRYSGRPRDDNPPPAAPPAETVGRNGVAERVQR